MIRGQVWFWPWYHPDFYHVLHVTMVVVTEIWVVQQLAINPSLSSSLLLSSQKRASLRKTEAQHVHKFRIGTVHLILETAFLFTRLWNWRYFSLSLWPEGKTTTRNANSFIFFVSVSVLPWILEREREPIHPSIINLSLLLFFFLYLSTWYQSKTHAERPVVRMAPLSRLGSSSLSQIELIHTNFCASSSTSKVFSYASVPLWLFSISFLPISPSTVSFRCFFLMHLQ